MSGFYFRDPNAPRPNQPRRVGVAALIDRNGELLLDCRVDPPGWGLIAGSVDEDESLADALRREVREETGLRVLSYRLFGVFSDATRIVRYADGNTYRTITVVFAVEAEGIEHMRPSSETTELRFVARNELGDLNVIATHRPIVDLYFSDGTPPYVD
jgi:8-oxo-dGTP pyrophosphatase MutT (NUDIX family)